MNHPQLCSPQRILMTTDTIGGVWTYAVELVRMLQEQDVQVALATMGALPSRAQRSQLRHLSNVHLFESRFKLEWMEKPWGDLERAGDWLLSLEQRLGPDVIHLNNYVHGALPFRAPTLVVGHSCVLSWWQAVKQESAPDSWNWYRHRVTRGLQAADLVIAPSRAMLTALQQHYGPLPCAEVIPNGRDPGSLVPLAKENFVFVAGRLWDQAKNLEAVIQAAPDLPWPVYVAGECQPPDRAAVQPAHVCLLGQLAPEALAPWFGRAALYAFPARYEPFGLSVLEAGLCGCALVLGDIASLRENWDGAARFVPPGDVAALQEILREMSTRADLLADYGRLALERALTFTPQRMLTGYLSAYAELMMTKAPLQLPATAFA